LGEEIYLFSIVTLKVYKEVDGEVDKKWYRVQNPDEVIALEICSGDTINIDGIGKLEVFGVDYESRPQGRNPFQSLIVTCGIAGSFITIGGKQVAI
jgi:hypothetical protein